MLSQLANKRDSIIFNHTPCIMAPIHGELDIIGLGHKRYIACKDGLYIEARTHALHVLLKLVDFPVPLPYGTVTPHVTLVAGRIPFEMISHFQTHAINVAPDEHAVIIAVSPNGEYELIRPRVISRSSGHITYGTEDIDNERIALDIHSHGYGESYFSSTDNISDEAGIKLSSVFGKCIRLDSMDITTRLNVYGHSVEFTGLPWEPNFGNTCTHEWVQL